MAGQRAGRGGPAEHLGPGGDFDKILYRLVAEAEANGTLQDLDVRNRYPDIADELLKALPDARAIAAAARTAREKPDATSAESPDGPGFEGDCTFLREALPSFEILEPIDRGGQGVVYKAVQKSTGRTVALKILLDDHFSSSRHQHRFAREIEIVSQLHHPNIVALYESGLVLNRPYFAMEFVEGVPLDDNILMHRPSIEERVKLFIKVCQGVGSAHRRGIIHRDLKPANILVDFDGEPHILDFGLAKDFEGDESMSAVSVTGQVVGTLPYLSPEQAQGKTDQVDTRSDIYSLGVVFYQILTGIMPYPAKGPPDVVRQRIVNQAPMSFRKALSCTDLHPYTKIGAIPDDLEQIVRKALAKEIDRRYQSADALVDDLERFLRGEAVSAKADSAWYVLRKTLARHRLHVAVASAFVLVLASALVATTVLWRRSDQLAHTYLAGLNAGSYYRLGTALRDEGRRKDAIEMLQKSLEIAAAAPSQDDSVIRITIEAHTSLAQELLEMNDLQAAGDHIRAALDLARAGVRQAPGNPEGERLLALVLYTQGRLLIAGKEFGRARESITQACNIREMLLVREPSNSFLKGEMPGTYQLLAKCLRGLNEQSEAGRYYKLAVDAQRKIKKDGPGSVDALIVLARTELGLAAWHAEQRTEDDYQSAIELLQMIQERLDSVRRGAGAAARALNISELQDAVSKNLQVIQRRRAKGAPSAPARPD